MPSLPAPQVGAPVQYLTASGDIWAATIVTAHASGAVDLYVQRPAYVGTLYIVNVPQAATGTSGAWNYQQGMSGLTLQVNGTTVG